MTLGLFLGLVLTLLPSSHGLGGVAYAAQAASPTSPPGSRQISTPARGTPATRTTPATLDAFALALLGHTEVSVYDGSWAEWGDADGVPIATGDG